MKRVIAILLTALMLVGLCAGCGSSGKGAASSAGSMAGSAAGSGAATDAGMKMCMPQ
ncbi:MAG: hypothetical protein LKJ86_05505 [Oscillibacter sp.]|jgi:hypothetical protein|nr:hypothetical protein [Oscillibacter sp.]